MHPEGSAYTLSKITCLPTINTTLASLLRKTYVPLRSFKRTGDIIRAIN
jgi:hypothetical protein